MKEFLIKYISFLFLVLILFWILDKWYTNYRNSHPNFCEKSDWILNKKSQTNDILFVGNSRVINMLNVNAFEEKSGYSALNLGLVGANYAENYLVTSKYLQNNNTAGIMAIQVDMHSLNSSTFPYPFHNTNYVHLLSDTMVQRTFKDNSTPIKYWLWKSIPFWRYMEFSSRFVLYKIVKGGFECKSNPTFDDNKGSDLSYTKVMIPERETYRYWTTQEMDIKYLMRLIQLARQNNLKPVLYTAPIFSGYKQKQLKLKDIFNSIKTTADSLQIPYFDFSSDKYALCRDTSKFSDKIHMNTTGINLFSLDLADSITRYFKK